MLATEWLINQLPTVDQDDSYNKMIIEKAKQMEIENMGEFAENYNDERIHYNWPTGEEYYHLLQSKK